MTKHMWNEQRMQELIQFQQQHGHCDVPADDEQYENLSSWIRQVRSSYHTILRNGRGDKLKLSEEVELTESHIADLENLGLDLDLLAPAKSGKRRLKQLLEYKRFYGRHYRAGASTSPGFVKLTEWLENLREANDVRSSGGEIPILMDVQLSQLKRIGYDIEQ